MAGIFDVLKQPVVEYPGGEYSLFNRISIETISFCNRSCHFCPCAWNDRGKTHMTDELYGKLVRELGELKFDGVAQLFLLSEPFIDKTLPAKAALLREACPDVCMYISSNGDVLDKLIQHKGMDAGMDLLRKHYEAGINVININVYDAGPEQLSRYKDYFERAAYHLKVRHTDHKYSYHGPKTRRMCITDMRFDERGDPESGIKTKGTDLFYIRNKQDRDKLADNKTVVPQTHCARTQRHIVVLFDGAVPICCAIDPNDRSTIVGDVNTQTLKEIWNNDKFFQYRYYTQQAKRVLPHCNTCTHKMSFPHIVRKVETTDEVKKRWALDVVS
jgi:radical SAM protein with 4Fe4S-binding SPASM domain